MSYILEALRKSEQERNPEKVPDLATHHRHIANPEKSKSLYWVLGVVLILINGFVLFYLMNKKPEVVETVVTPVVEQPVPAPIPAPEIITLPKEDVIKEVVVAEKSVEEIIAEVPVTTIPKTTSSFERAVIPNISELDYDLQRQIPDMDFSTHIYVRDGGSFIIINGQSISEGMSVVRGLRVTEILSDGIILEFKGRRFFMASMTSWHQN